MHAETLSLCEATFDVELAVQNSEQTHKLNTCILYQPEFKVLCLVVRAMLCYLSPVQRYQSLKRRCWWLQEKVGIQMLNNAVLAVQGLMKVRQGNWSLLSLARIAARCKPAWCSSDPQIGRTLCRCSEEKFVRPVANAACSSTQLVGPRRRDLEGRQPLGGRSRRALEDPKLKDRGRHVT